MGKGQSLQQTVPEQLDIHMQKNEVDSSLISYTKINSKCIKRENS